MGDTRNRVPSSHMAVVRKSAQAIVRALRRYRRKFHLIAALASLALVSCAKAPDMGAVEKSLDKMAAEIIGDDTRATAHKEFRNHQKVDVDANGSVDVISFFAVEGFGGSNVHKEYMAVFVNNEGAMSSKGYVEIGWRGTRTVNTQDVKVSKGVIELRTLGYDEDDGMCCPTKEGKTWYSLLNGVRELPAAP